MFCSTGFYDGCFFVLFTLTFIMVGIFSYYTVCVGLVLSSSMLFHFLSVTLPMPAPEVLGAMIKVQLMEYLEILITNLVPAIGFSLVIRKLTS